MARGRIGDLLGRTRRAAQRMLEERAPTAAAFVRAAGDRETAEALRHGRVRIPAREITAMVGRCAHLAQVGVRCVPGLVLVDGTDEEGAPRRLAVAIEQAVLAPRGGKELVVALEPPERAREPWARHAALGVAAAVAARLGIETRASGDALEAALSREEDEGCLRIDLRALGPSVSRFGDVMPVSRIDVVEGGIELVLPIPTLRGRAK